MQRERSRCRCARGPTNCSGSPRRVHWVWHGARPRASREMTRMLAASRIATVLRVILRPAVRIRPDRARLHQAVTCQSEDLLVRHKYRTHACLDATYFSASMCLECANGRRSHTGRSTASHLSVCTSMRRMRRATICIQCGDPERSSDERKGHGTHKARLSP